MNLYIVTFYDMEGKKDWEPIVAETQGEAEQILAHQMKKDFEVDMQEYDSDIEAYPITQVGEYKIEVIK